MDKIWLDQYPAGVPAEIDADSWDSVVAMFEHTVLRFADRPAFTDANATLTFSSLERLSRAFAAYLQKDLEIKKGDRIAIILPNILQFPVALFGIIRSGAIATNINPSYTGRELQYQLNDADVKAIVCLENVSPVVAQLLPPANVQRVIVTRLDDLLSDCPESRGYKDLNKSVSFISALTTGKKLKFDPLEICGKDTIFLQYTGGTTGISKGAMLTHRNLVANILQCNAILESKSQVGAETIITALPLYHIFALTINCLAFFYSGGHNILITDPRNLAGMVRTLSKWKFSIITGVNTLYNALLNYDDFKKLDFSALKISLAGGAPVHPVVADRWLKTTGCRLLEGYGLTETSPLLTANIGESSDQKNSIGLPVPSTEISLRDFDGEEVSIGKRGELWARGPQVMRGYWRNTKATDAAFTADGFFKTGDIATVDEDGYFYIVDRKKDMILVSGFNVFPNEVEQVIAEHEDVLENACVGVPDERSGECVKAFVVVRPGARVSAEDIRNHCKQYLTAYKVPKFVEFRDALPKSSIGKILRRELNTSLEKR